jgi:Kef-type K+ transport system membrane component KefB
MSLLPLAVVILVAWAIAIGIKKAANKYPSVVANQNPSGVGGWLLLLVVGLIFLGPVMGAGRINLDLMSVEAQYPNIKNISEWNTYKSATWWTFFGVCCLSFYAGLGLAKDRNIQVVKRTMVVLWIVGPVASLILGMLLPILIFGKSEPNPQFIGTMIASVIAATIWTTYLYKSKRVKSTYGINASST